MASATNSDPTSIGLTQLSETIFGKEIINNLKNKGIPVRNIWEISSPTTQCNNIIGKVQNGEKCWICGLSIQEDKAHKGLNPECEHILPIAQAVIFLSLYRTGSPEENKVLQNLEYAWAHSVCNQEKSDICALVAKNSGDSVGVSKKSIIEILSKIYFSPRSVSFTRNLRTAYSSFKAFVEARFPEIKVKYKAITDFINGQNDDRYRLCILAGVISAQDPENIREDLQEFLDPGARSIQEAAQEQLRAELTGQVQSDLQSHFGADSDDKITLLSMSVEIYGYVLNRLNNEILNTKFFTGITARSEEVLNEFFDIDIRTKEGKSYWIESVLDNKFQFILNQYNPIYEIVSIHRLSETNLYDATKIGRETIEILSDFLIYYISTNILFFSSKSTKYPRSFIANINQIIQKIGRHYDKEYPGLMEYLTSEYIKLLYEEGKGAFLHFVETHKSAAEVQEFYDSIYNSTTGGYKKSRKHRRRNGSPRRKSRKN